jgi:hypothetical protein
MTQDPYRLAGASAQLAECPTPSHESQAFEGSRTTLTVEQILVWADAFHETHGSWPKVGPGSVSRVVAGAPRELWKDINKALVLGLRGLPGNSSLAELLAERRGVPLPEPLPDRGPKLGAEKSWTFELKHCPVKGPQVQLREERKRPADLTIAAILAWADAHHEAHGEWPRSESKPIEAAPDETWTAVDYALRLGRRGLPGGSSLRRLLTEHRGPQADHRLPRLTLAQILAWADAHHAATGNWPIRAPIAVTASPSESWDKIDEALRRGDRGLAGRRSLAGVLARHRASRIPPELPNLTIEGILAWADGYHAVTGKWPRKGSGPVAGVTYEVTWKAINEALQLGGHGLTGGTTLARLLAEQRDVRAPLTVERILSWADAFHKDHGYWPRPQQKPVAGTRGETWRGIDKALKVGSRGLPGGSSLTQLLVAHRGEEAGQKPPRLTLEKILAWADAHHAITGHWPVSEPVAVTEAPDETWEMIDRALRRGHRGLKGKTCLELLLARHRGPRPPGSVARLTADQILAWAEGHRKATGVWPNRRSGPIAGVPGERWESINLALLHGFRGLPGGLTLAQFLHPLKQLVSQRELAVSRVLAWADAYHTAHGIWPTQDSARVSGACRECGRQTDLSPCSVCLGLPRGLTLEQVLAEHRSQNLSPAEPPSLQSL